MSFLSNSNDHLDTFSEFEALRTASLMSKNGNDGSCCAPSMSKGPTEVASDVGCGSIEFGRGRIGKDLEGNTAYANSGSTEGMVRLEGNSFFMGTEDDDAWVEDGEGPVREVSLTGFYLDTRAVTNTQFAEFVEETGYRTEAECFGWSYVFKTMLPRSKQRKLKSSHTVMGLQWWYAVEGCTWRKPEGSGSNLKRRMDHPVIHVSWNDAIAYSRWAGKRLPTEAEWEYAARGGLVGKRYPWGDELTPQGKHRCNIWQGRFPEENTARDGFKGTAPTGAYTANGYGFFNMSGNVWEWCSDWFSPHWHLRGARKDPRGPDLGDRKVMKGGSYLCHRSYCNRYRVAARTSNTPDSSTGNCGFRCARDL